MMLFETLKFILTFIFIYVSAFLIHELMHIKGQGILNTGNIYVWKYGMTVSSDSEISEKWFYYSGGILTSLILFIVAILSSGYFRESFIVNGWMQLLYGIYEGYTYGNVKFRYFIYLGVILLYVMVRWVI